MTHTRVISTPSELQSWRASITGAVGFVPTMGALHEGHVSLLNKSRAENTHSVLSVFVNPTQFNQAHDLEKYPRTWEADLKYAQDTGTDVIFCPKFEDMYPDDYTFSVNENDFSTLLCGASRPGHFKGVLTIVLKLINLARPDKVYMGEKDFQQLQLIKKMVAALFLPTKIIGCPTVRNTAGLALSSRNARLTDVERTQSALIYKIISQAQTSHDARTDLEAAGFKIDYVADIEGRRYVAVFIGDVRLIDNVAL